MREFYKKLYGNTKKEFLKDLQKKIEKEERNCVVTANPEIFMQADKNSSVRNLLLDQETSIVADGIGIVVGGNKLGYAIPERIPGVEICSELFEYADMQKKKIFLFGSNPEVLETLVRKMRKDYPRIDLCGYEHGYVSDKDLVFEKMKDVRPDIILVALGAPLQETLIYKHIKEFDKGIFIGVGGSFDVLSGCKKRAPQLFVKLNLEWLYRITTEPKRLKRFWQNNVKFLFAIRKEKK